MIPSVSNMDSDILRKFREANYFLQQVREQEILGNTEVFLFNLSAFTSAARALPLIIVAKYNTLEKTSRKYIDFKNKIDREIKADPIFEYLKEKRNQNLKVKPVHANRFLMFRPDPPFTSDDMIQTEDEEGKIRRTLKIKHLPDGQIEINGQLAEDGRVQSGFEFIFDDLEQGNVIAFCTHIIDKYRVWLQELDSIIEPD